MSKGPVWRYGGRTRPMLTRCRMRRPVGGGDANDERRKGGIEMKETTLPEVLRERLKTRLSVFEVVPQLRDAGDGRIVHTGAYELVEHMPDSTVEVHLEGSYEECARALREKEAPIKVIFRMPQETAAALDVYLEARKARGEQVTKQDLLAGLVNAFLAAPENLALILEHLGK